MSIGGVAEEEGEAWRGLRRAWATCKQCSPSFGATKNDKRQLHEKGSLHQQLHILAPVEEYLVCTQLLLHRLAME